MIEFKMWKDVFDLDNPLTLEYFELCSNATDEKVYKDKHHILPVALFKEYKQSSWNIVSLTYQDHYRAHEILPLICLQQHHKHKMLRAWNLILHTKDGLTVSRSEFATLKAMFRDAQSIAQKNRTLSPETRSKIGVKHTGINNINYGKPMDPIRKSKMVATKSLKLDVFLQRLKETTTFTLVSGYTAMSKLAWFQCENEHTPFQMTPTHVMEGRVCPLCFQDTIKQRGVDFINWLATNTNFTMIGEFKGMTSDTTFKCDKGHPEFTTKPSYMQRPLTNDAKHARTGCKHCNKELRKIKREAKKLAKEQNAT